MKLAFYKGKGNLIDKLIRWWTSSKYSHVELVHKGTWYSTSPRDLKVRKAYIGANPNNWDFVEVRGDEETLKDFYEKTKGAKYDWVNIVFSQILPFRVHLKNRYICSEWCAEALGYENPEQYSPDSLYEEALIQQVFSKN